MDLLQDLYDFCRSYTLTIPFPQFRLDVFSVGNWSRAIFFKELATGTAIPLDQNHRAKISNYNHIAVV